MKKLNIALVAISLMLSACMTSCQKENEITPTTNDGALDRRNPNNCNIRPVQLFIFNGESNSGGIAPNADATQNELAPQSQVQIWNNFTNHFESLHVGVNNLLGHWALEPWSTTGHGWELELSNIIRNQYPEKKVYLLKTGQGGTTISQWDTTGNFYHTMCNRIDSAMTELRRLHRPIQVFVFYSQGINDVLYSHIADTTWQRMTQEHLNRIKAHTGQDTRIVMCKHMQYYDAYNQSMVNICNADSTGRTTYIEMTGATTISDGLHYDYQGMKLLTDRLFANIQNYIR